MVENDQKEHKITQKMIAWLVVIILFYLFDQSEFFRETIKKEKNYKQMLKQYLMLHVKDWISLKY